MFTYLGSSGADPLGCRAPVWRELRRLHMPSRVVGVKRRQADPEHAEPGSPILESGSI